MNRKPRITEKDIQEALRKFRREGRLIRRLPDQAAPRSRLVAAGYGAYENPLQGAPGAERF